MASGLKGGVGAPGCGSVAVPAAPTTVPSKQLAHCRKTLELSKQRVTLKAEPECGKRTGVVVRLWWVVAVVVSDPPRHRWAPLSRSHRLCLVSDLTFLLHHDLTFFARFVPALCIRRGARHRINHTLRTPPWSPLLRPCLIQVTDCDLCLSILLFLVCLGCVRSPTLELLLPPHHAHTHTLPPK